MFRYLVTTAVRDSINGVIGRPIFYQDGTGWYIDSPKHLSQFTYYDAGTDQNITRSLDQICQDLYTTDFAAQSTEEEVNVVEQVELAGKQTTNTKVPIVAVQKGEGTDFSRASHDWTDRTTWYQDSVRVTGESPSNTGLTYTLANNNVINLVSGNVSDEDEFSSPYVVKIYDGGVEVTSGFTIDYDAGTITFDSAPSGAVTVDYSYENGSTYTIAPDAGKILYLEHAEIQFSGAVTLSPLEFQIWAYNPFDLPNKIMVRRKVYKNARDILNSANLGTGVIKAFGELTQDIQVFPFNYVKLQPLVSSQGIEVRLKITNDVPFTGEFSTVTFYCFSEDEA